MSRGHSLLALQTQARAAAVWAAAVNAVGLICGSLPPTAPGVLVGGRRHTRREVELRKLALYTAACGLDCAPTRVARAAGLDKDWVVQVVRDMEDRRDAADVDDLLTRLERQARQLLDNGTQTTGRAA